MEYHWKTLDDATRRGHRQAPATSLHGLARSPKRLPRRTRSDDGSIVTATTLRLTAELREREAGREALAARVDAARVERAAAEERAAAAVRVRAGALVCIAPLPSA
jgi:hypothetical protein